MSRGRFPIPTSILAPVGVALAYGLSAVASLAMTQGPDGIAAMWPASGVLLAGVVRFDARRIAWCLVLAAAASMAANLDVGNAALTSAGFTLANMVEALVGATLLRRWGLIRPRFTEARDVASFCLAALLAALTSTAIAVVASDIGDPLFALSWFTTVMLGLLIVAPLVLICWELVEGADTDTRPTASLPTILLLLGAVALTSAIVFGQDRFPLLFLPLVALLAATYRLGPFGAAAGIAIIAVVAPALTRAGHGSINLSARDSTEACFFLQFYLLTLFASALPFGALLSRQRRLDADLAESERMHRLLADSSTDVILRLALDGTAGEQ